MSVANVSPLSAVNITSPLTSTTGLYCFNPYMVVTNGIWVENSFQQVFAMYSFPPFMIQLSIIVIFTKALAIVLKPLKQPRVVAEILGGILIGPSALGRLRIDENTTFGGLFFPSNTFMNLETAMNLGLLYFMFTVGVGIDVEAIKRTGRKAIAIAASSIAFPFTVSIAAGPYLFRYLYTHPETKTTINLAGDGMGPSTSDSDVVEYSPTFYLFLSVSLSVTAVPVLARIQGEIKIINTEVGRLTLSSSMMTVILAWILLTIAMAITGDNRFHVGVSSLGMLFSGIAFMLVCFYVVRPASEWVARHTPEGKPLDPQYMGLILIGVLVAASITEAIGIHFAVGAFVFGLAMPSGPLAVKVLETIEESPISYLTILYFADTGLKINVSDIKQMHVAWALGTIFAVASAAKLVGAFLVTRFYNMPFHDGLALAFMMNTKGLFHMLIFDIGMEKQILDKQSFTVLVLVSTMTTALVTPALALAYRPTRQQIVAHKRRNLQLVRSNSELRLLACVHSVKNVPSIISLLDAVNPTKRSPIFVYALHLIELAGRSSAMLIVHQSAPQNVQHRRAQGSRNAQSEHVVSAFERYEQQAGGVSIQTLTAIASYATMHEDVCALAEDKRVALIILPFDKQPTAEGSDRREAANSAISTVNRNVLLSARCSVAILVDRGLGGTGRLRGWQEAVGNVVLLFFGGPDNREALAFVSRMAEHPDINLLVVRFVPGEEAASAKTPSNLTVSSKERPESRIITPTSQTLGMDREQDMDDKCINDFRLRHAQNESVVYVEEVVNNCEETVTAIRSIEGVHQLYVVGRGNGVASPMTAGMEEWSQCPELGPIGDLLASSDIGVVVSVLVFQQHVVAPAEGAAAAADGGDSPRQQNVANADYRESPYYSGPLSARFDRA